MATQEEFHCDLQSDDVLETIAKKLTKRNMENAETTKTTLADLGPHKALLTDDILLHIASFLNTKELKTCRFVCQDWARAMGRELAGHVIKTIALVAPEMKDRILREKAGDYEFSLCATRDYLEFLKRRNKHIGMRIRKYQILDVDVDEAARKEFLEDPEILENITFLEVVTNNLEFVLPYVSKMKLLKELFVFDRETHIVLLTDTQMLEGLPEPGQNLENICQVEKLVIDTLVLQRSNVILKMILPMCPKLKSIDIAEVHKNNQCFCLRVIRKFGVTASLQTLRMHQKKPKGYNKPGIPMDERGLGTMRVMNDDVWPPTEVEVGEKIGTSIRQFVKNPIAQNLQNFHVQPWHYVPNWEWRKIFNTAKTKNVELVTLDLAVIVASHFHFDCVVQSWQDPKSPSVIIKQSPKNPEPMDYMSFFPKNSDNTTMTSLKSLVLDLFYNIRTQFGGGPEMKYTMIKPFCLTTSRVLPSVTCLCLHLCPWVDVSSNFATAFPNLKILTIYKEELMRFNNLLKNAPPTLEELYLLKGDKITEDPKLGFYCALDEQFIKENAIMSVPKLRKLVIGVCACNLTDKLVFKGLLNLPELSELYIQSITKFTRKAKTALQKKLKVCQFQ